MNNIISCGAVCEFEYSNPIILIHLLVIFCIVNLNWESRVTKLSVSSEVKMKKKMKISNVNLADNCSYVKYLSKCIQLLSSTAFKTTKVYYRFYCNKLSL